MTSVPPPRLPRPRSLRRRRLSRSTALFALVGGCALLADGPASASGTGTLSPYLDCVTTNPQTGDVTAYYGYHNTTGTALTINVGENNQTFPIDAFQGQPTYFNQGTRSCSPASRGYSTGRRPTLPPRPPELFRLIARRLGVDPQDCLYVGDGGGDELTGATNCGMRAFMLRADDWGVNDAHAREDDWTGPALPSRTDVMSLTPL